MISPILAILAVLFAGVLGICAVVFIGVPVLKVIGSAFVAVLRGFGWLLAHIAGFVVGMLRDSVRFLGALIATILFFPALAGSVVIGRWSAASHFASSITRELRVGGACLFRVVVQRPLRLLLLDGLLEGIEQRVPPALAEAPGADRPNHRMGQFAGYRIVGSLRPGGSGAKLYVAEPEPALRSRKPGIPAQVVIKTFAITDGSSLPQIVRESRALDAARQLGLIIDHGLDEQRFFYVMPYHPGESLGVVTRQLHGESEGDGLIGTPLRHGIGYVVDLVETLHSYHQGGLWHKDVKPENIIVHAGRAHLVDLGLVTPLRSAMTLTTHGTEYFRDPEMVRLALRGVKVHQVDGAKFDVYASGAVLYFVLENTFPAHGALSSFSKRSPEALRWIVRRAMADYGKRYEDAGLLLADLRYVADSADPAAVRPADLPSMRGGAHASSSQPESWSPDPGQAPAYAVANIASPSASLDGQRRGSPIPPSPDRYAAGAAGGAVGDAASGGGLRSAPKIEVTNWWTGQYRVAGQGAADSAAVVSSPPHGATRAAAFRRPAPPPLAPRPSAAAQRQSARARTEQRRGAAAQHVAARLHRPAVPGASLVIMIVLLIGGILGGTMLAAGVFATSVRQKEVHARASAPNSAARNLTIDAAQTGRPALVVPVPPSEAVGYRASSGADSGVVVSKLDGSKPEGLRTLLVNAHADPAAPATLAAVDRAVAEQESAGRTVCRDDLDAVAKLFVLLPRWQEGDASADESIEGLMEERGYASILWVTGSADARGKVNVMHVHAEREGARLRAGACGE